MSLASVVDLFMSRYLRKSSRFKYLNFLQRLYCPFHLEVEDDFFGKYFSIESAFKFYACSTCSQLNLNF